MIHIVHRSRQIRNHNMDSYQLRRTLLSRAASTIRDRIHRLYGPGWDGRMAAATAEPDWLKAVWRWCGIQFIGFSKFPLLRVGSSTKTFEQDSRGTWWCITTFTPAKYPDIREIINDNILRDIGVPDDPAFLGEVAAAHDRAYRDPSRTAIEVRAVVAKFWEHYKATLPQIRLLDHDQLLESRKAFVGVDWGSGAAKGGMAIVSKSLLGMRVRVVPEGSLPEGVAGVIGPWPQPGKHIDPGQFTVIKHQTPQPTMQSQQVLSHSIRFLRRPDLLEGLGLVAHQDAQLRHFKDQEAIERASDVVFIDGVRHKVLKGEPAPYKASYFHPSRHTVQVVDDRLISSFQDDEPLGIKAGTLICEPWTEDDSAACDPDDDVMGATVTRHGKLFHDTGVYIPANS